MDKQTLSAVLAQSPREEVIALAGEAAGGRSIVLVKPAEKTLVMLKVRESVKQSLFYLGEIIATECLVEVDGNRGACVLMGDDQEKARAMAVIDAAHTAGFPQWPGVEARVNELGADVQRKRAEEAALHRKTQVRFSIMEDRDGE